MRSSRYAQPEDSDTTVLSGAALSSLEMSVPTILMVSRCQVSRFKSPPPDKSCALNPLPRTRRPCSNSSHVTAPYWTGSGRTYQAERRVWRQQITYCLHFSARCIKAQCWLRCCSLCTRQTLRTLCHDCGPARCTVFLHADDTQMYLHCHRDHLQSVPLNWNCVFPRLISGWQPIASNLHRED